MSARCLREPGRLAGRALFDQGRTRTRRSGTRSLFRLFRLFRWCVGWCLASSLFRFFRMEDGSCSAVGLDLGAVDESALEEQVAGVVEVVAAGVSREGFALCSE